MGSRRVGAGKRVASPLCNTTGLPQQNWLCVKGALQTVLSRGSQEMQLYVVKLANEDLVSKGIKLMSLLTPGSADV